MINAMKYEMEKLSKELLFEVSFASLTIPSSNENETTSKKKKKNTEGTIETKKRKKSSLQSIAMIEKKNMVESVIKFSAYPLSHDMRSNYGSQK